MASIPVVRPRRVIDSEGIGRSGTNGREPDGLPVRCDRWADAACGHRHGGGNGSGAGVPPVRRSRPRGPRPARCRSPTGSACGLTVIVAGLVDQFGWQVTTLITVGAGVLQLGFGLSRLARFTQAIPPAVVHGMLAGIGLTIALAQLHVVLGGSAQTGAPANLRELPAQLTNLHGGAVLVGLTAIAIMGLWPRLPGPQKSVPGALVAVAAATGLSVALSDVPRVDLPGNLVESVALPVLPDSGLWLGVLGGMLTVAQARRHPHRPDPRRAPALRRDRARRGVPQPARGRGDRPRAGRAADAASRRARPGAGGGADGHRAAPGRRRGHVELPVGAGAGLRAEGGAERRARAR
ncbi:hypothetical protein LWC33_26500 [Pseudonocardia sp. RS11V-5]|uniref:SulP family inorganic anion transporter n=1 Tax=Pseudonocardia terrae TaxID=2905831 RepID=UPI001E59E0B1|nr:SulP family inorganic anion transporter [Pseudonocardia terrae]MCE3554991.1 hypothetical protein [Pseudonocardia terrae]